jgi:hypothetical protein
LGNIFCYHISVVTANTTGTGSINNGTWSYRSANVQTATANTRTSSKSLFVGASSNGYIITPLINSGVAEIKVWVKSAGTSNCKYWCSHKYNNYGKLKCNFIYSWRKFWASSTYKLETSNKLSAGLVQLTFTANITSPAYVKIQRIANSMYIDDIVTRLVAAPTTQASNIGFTNITHNTLTTLDKASNIVFSNISYNSLTTAWTNGDGAKRAVFMKEGVQGTITNPSDATAYTASADWSSKGTQLGTSGYYCVYNGTAATVDLSSLSGSTTYWFQVFEYNGTGAGTKYLTTTATNNPNSQLTDPTPVAYFYKSKQTGNWGDASSWLSSSDDITYIDAVTAPSASDNAISILNTHEITVNTGSVSVDELTVAVGGKLIVSAGATLSVVNGTGADLTVNGSLTLAGTFASAASSTIAVNGTFENQIDAASFSAGSGAMTINAGGTYKINGYTANAVLTFTNVSFTDGIDAAGATLYIASGAPRIPSAQNGNVIWNTPSSGNSIFNSASNSITGSFTIIATVGVNNGSGGSGRSVTVGGNMYMQGGIYHVSGSGATAANNMTVNGDLVVSGGTLYASATTAGGGSGTIFVKGNIDYSGGELGSSSTVTSGTINFIGTTAQAVAINSTNPILIGNLVVNNAAGVTLSGTEFFNVYQQLL